MEGNPYLAKQYGALEKKINALSIEVHNLRWEISENNALLQGLTRRQERMKAGEQDDPRAHIRHLAKPDDPGQLLRLNRAAETWAAISLSLLMFAFAAFIFFAPKYIGVGLGNILILFLVAEAILRGAFIQTVARITLILATITLLILLIHFWKWIIVGALVIMGISLMYNRLRELTG